MNWMEQKSEPSQRDAALVGSRVPTFCDHLSVPNSRTWTAWLLKKRPTNYQTKLCIIQNVEALNPVRLSELICKQILRNK